MKLFGGYMSTFEAYMDELPVEFRKRAYKGYFAPNKLAKKILY